ncbi:carbohydrate esterase family 8 protein [Saccharata proteae CBS 121410]|uniref:Pectinesterase n=1 Tax=Saccharata proteae CBS 121410 TaxID=1314787 RepID=A0A9P4LWE5_9PEZI|nr:carbohydrate esterase family 8 protein [Saccharata proteae CBS 121410]
MFKFLSLLALAASVQALTSPPSGALVVGSDDGYSTVQDAVDALDTSTSDTQYIFIYQGTYDEQVYIQSLNGALKIYGYSEDDSSYSSNTVTITQALALADVSTDDETGTLRVWTENFSLYNVNLENSYGKGGQALALSAEASYQGYYGCKFIGYQDTILAEKGYQLYANSYIEGATDFIFGQSASAWFENCDIRVLSASVGYVTASGRASSSSTSYYVINNSNVAAKSGETVSEGAYYLGRPWGKYARVAFQNTELSDVINSAGWSKWSTSDTRTSDVVFGEYKNSGDGASGTRAYETKLSSAVKIAKILGSDYADYFDTSYL